MGKVVADITGDRGFCGGDEVKQEGVVADKVVADKVVADITDDRGLCVGDEVLRGR